MSDDILTLVIAPTNDCNMSCSYCYNRYNQNETKLEMILLDHLIRITFRSVRRVHFVWRGGEPLLVGSDYFESVFKLQEKYSKIYGTFYDNSIQTNGTMLNKRWLKILMKKKVSIGISFDGLINNKYRGNTDSIVEAFELCKKKKMPVGCIMVVNPSEHSLIEHYTYMKRYVNSIKPESVKFSFKF